MRYRTVEPRACRACPPALFTPGRGKSDDAAAYLLEFDGFKESLEVALAEAFVALALDDFEENRAEYIGREDLQENAVLRRSINENAAARKLRQVLLVTRDATARFTTTTRICR